MAKRGKSLELIVSIIERVLAGKVPTKIESPKRLRDRTTGKHREHDVVLTTQQGHHTLLIAIECRDRSRPVGVPDIEAFYAKCNDTGINQGIIVSPRGFYSSARIKAEHYGIKCLDLEDVNSFNWLLTPGINTVIKTLIKHDWKFLHENEGTLITKENMVILAPDGTPINMDILGKLALKILDQLLSQDPKLEERNVITVRVLENGLTLLNKETGETIPVKCCDVVITYSIDHEINPFRLMQYRQKATDQYISDVAVAELKVGNINTGNIMIVYKEDEGGQIVFVPSPLESAKIINNE